MASHVRQTRGPFPPRSFGVVGVPPANAKAPSIATSIESIATTDVDPTTAPYRISAIATKNDATVKFRPVTSDGSPIKAWRVTFNGNRKTGKLAGNLGCVCGLDRCGAPGVMPVNAAANVQHTEEIMYPETGGPADGAYTVEVACASETAGWG